MKKLQRGKKVNKNTGTKAYIWRDEFNFSDAPITNNSHVIFDLIFAKKKAEKRFLF
jgi:hypothetical protein